MTKLLKKQHWYDTEALSKIPNKKLKNFNRGLKLCWDWMRAHNIELPGLIISSDDRWVEKNYGLYHNFRRREVAINIGKCSFSKRLHGIVNQGGGIEDFTPEGVLCHEVGHHVDRVLGTRRNGRSWLSYSPLWIDVISHEEDISRFEHDVLESFAEAFRLFITNPDLLRVGRLERYEFFVDKLGWRPIKPLTPWRVVLRGATPAYKRMVARWIERGIE